MPKQIDIDEILKKNPHVKREDLKELEQLAEALRAFGQQKQPYRLVPPYGGQQVHILQHKYHGGEDPEPHT